MRKILMLAPLLGLAIGYATPVKSAPRGGDLPRPGIIEGTDPRACHDVLVRCINNCAWLPPQAKLACAAGCAALELACIVVA